MRFFAVSTRRMGACLLVVVLAGCGGRPPIGPPAPGLSLGEWVLGAVRQDDEPATHVFSKVNTSEATWQVVDARVSCGCIKVMSHSAVVRPGESLEVMVGLRTRGMTGRVSQQVEIVLADNRMLIGRISANVLPGVHLIPSALEIALPEDVTQVDVHVLLAGLRDAGASIPTVTSSIPGLTCAARRVDGSQVVELLIHAEHQSSEYLMGQLRVAGSDIDGPYDLVLPLSVAPERPFIATPMTLFVPEQAGNLAIPIWLVPRERGPLPLVTISSSIVGASLKMERDRIEVDLRHAEGVGHLGDVSIGVAGAQIQRVPVYRLSLVEGE